jgi:hypothetical protein
VKRALLWVAGVALLLAAGAAAIYGPRVVDMAEVGSGYVAKQMCSCIYVAERDFDGCRRDIPQSMDAIEAELLEKRPGVRAHVIGVERLAVHTPDAGCHLLP